MAARVVVILLAAAAMTAPAVAAEPVLLHAAGSLRTALTEVAARSRRRRRQGAGEVRPFGHAQGRDRGRARAEVFASANMEHPQTLAKAGKSGPVVLFARNRLCALVRPGSRSHPRPCSSACSMPGVKLGTSTPRRSGRRLRLGGVPQGR